MVNKSFNFNEQCEILLTKANQKFGILKRTCHFFTCKNMRRDLYLALVSSQFEYCSPVWRPGCITIMNKFESFQKKCLKWILSEEDTFMRFIEVNVSNLIYLPYPWFNFDDMNLFHKIVYKTIPVNIPDYLTLYSGHSRLRRTHLDNLSFESNVASTTPCSTNLNKSFFVRTDTLWNTLPFDIINSMRLSQFKIKLAKHLWSISLFNNEQPEHEWSFQSSDEGG